MKHDVDLYASAQRKRRTTLEYERQDGANARNANVRDAATTTQSSQFSKTMNFVADA